MQGATVSNSAVIDSLEVTDFDFLSVGKNAVIGKGTTIISHTVKDGNLFFSQASLLHSVTTLVKSKVSKA